MPIHTKLLKLLRIFVLKNIFSLRYNQLTQLLNKIICINSVSGNKAIMTTTSPSLLINLKSNIRGKTSCKRRRAETNFNEKEEIETINSMHPIQYKPITTNLIYFYSYFYKFINFV